VTNVGNDTTIFFTGTSNDKKRNVLFSVLINRQVSSANALSANLSLSFLYIDSASAYYITSPYSSTSSITFKISSFAQGILQGSFSGSINSPDGLAHTIINGKINCTTGQGKAAPKFFSFNENANTLPGYIDYARLSANSLIINGTSFSNHAQKFKFIVRTGGTIKTGVYKSTNGDVGLQVSQQGIFTDYVNDSLGNLTINITSVNGDIVSGTFSGTASAQGNNSSNTISNGNFSCQVTGYQPKVDSYNKWSFSEDEPMFNYNIYGGNVVNVSFTDDGPKSYFTLNGESDNGASVFKIKISDYHPITTTLYQTGYYYLAHVDSMFFSSNAKIDSNTSTYFYMYDDYVGYCNIDTLDDHHIVGTLSGKVELSLGAARFTSTEIKEATFRASF
jgi:hypothetical protein